MYIQTYKGGDYFSFTMQTLSKLSFFGKYMVGGKTILRRRCASCLLTATSTSRLLPHPVRIDMWCYFVEFTPEVKITLKVSSIYLVKLVYINL